MNTMDELIGTLQPQTKNRFAGQMHFNVDSTKDLFVYTWRELAAGPDPFIDYEEYYRLDLPLQAVRDFLQRSYASDQACTEQIEGKVIESYTRNDDYSGTTGGMGNNAWNTPCDEVASAREVKVELKFTRGEPSLYIDITSK